MLLNQTLKTFMKVNLILHFLSKMLSIGSILANTWKNFFLYSTYILIISDGVLWYRFYLCYHMYSFNSGNNYGGNYIPIMMLFNQAYENLCALEVCLFLFQITILNRLRQKNRNYIDIMSANLDMSKMSSTLSVNLEYMLQRTALH